jgi:potassium efflux system protein
MLATIFIGFWLIWAGVLPALGIFSRVELWPEFLKLHGPRGSEELTTQTIVTLGDLIIASVIAVITFTASRNIPGFLEITVLRRLSIDAGLRYAICTISRYLITVVGVLAVSSRVGVGWSQVQWLVAAISVGLGFGLQEIFANFISGLILLFERPIRIGDTVSVGDVTGKVSRIRIRATTITDAELRELIVPNKEFITGRVMNWTLTDTTSRMSFKFTVAYGSDPDQVRQLLLDVARKHPLVIKEPAPHALLDDLGDSAMVFTLRVFMASMDTALQVRHELHSAVVAALDAAGIEIPFPQRDLRIRSMADMHSIEDALSASNGKNHG